MTKSSEMSREAFGIAVAEKLNDLRSRALAAGVPKEQLEEIITSVYGQTQDLSITTAINRIKNAFLGKIEAASATLLVGVLVGSRDRVGKNMPIKYTLIKKDKQHVEISNFGTTAQYQGEKITIPVPALVEVRALHDPEYDSWELKEIVSYRPIDQAGLVKVLTSVVIPIKDINKDMAYAQGRAAKPVVIAGEMNYLRAEVVFKQRDFDDTTSKAEIDHSLPVMMTREMAKDQSDALPCFQFSVKGKGQGANSVRCHLSQMRHGTPTTMITDIIPLASRAVEKHRNDPDEQVKDLNEWLKEMNVLVVGTVSTFKKTYTEDKSERNYIDIGVSCVVELEGTFEGTGTQKTLETPKSAPHITTETQPIAGKIQSTTPAPSPAPAPAPEPEEEEDAELIAAQKKLDAAKAAKAAKAAAKAAPVAAATATQQAQEQAPSKDIEQVAKMIKVYCRAAGIKPTDVTLEILKAKALDIVDGVPDAVVIDAINYLKAVSAATGA